MASHVSLPHPYHHAKLENSLMIYEFQVFIIIYTFIFEILSFLLEILDSKVYIFFVIVYPIGWWCAESMPRTCLSDWVLSVIFSCASDLAAILFCLYTA